MLARESARESAMYQEREREEPGEDTFALTVRMDEDEADTVDEDHVSPTRKMFRAGGHAADWFLQQ